jgi:7,8-didemethyl-8-hydroxy-5-deazariboflavin synthase
MGRSRRVFWSPSLTLVPTRQCFNACDYCSFRRPPGSGSDSLDAAAARAQLQARPAASEVLLLSGEVPPQAPERRAWLGRLLQLSRLALAHGRLPHTNAGPLLPREMAALGRLNPSMGLMLEGLGPAVERAHRHAPSKRLELRIGQLQLAGRLGIPFTTGLLLGLGETRAHRRDALELLDVLQQQWGHIQEVILQPWRPDGLQATPLDPAARADLLETIAMAREILPSAVHRQMPPNLWPLEHLLEAVDAGTDDLGGIDTGDVINPAYPQPDPAALAAQLARGGYHLQPRLCVHDAWLPWLPAALQRAAAIVSVGL